MQAPKETGATSTEALLKFISYQSDNPEMVNAIRTALDSSEVREALRNVVRAEEAYKGVWYRYNMRDSQRDENDRIIEVFGHDPEARKKAGNDPKLLAEVEKYKLDEPKYREGNDPILAAFNRENDGMIAARKVLEQRVQAALKGKSGEELAKEVTSRVTGPIGNASPSWQSNKYDYIAAFTDYHPEKLETATQALGALDIGMERSDGSIVLSENGKTGRDGIISRREISRIANTALDGTPWKDQESVRALRNKIKSALDLNGDGKVSMEEIERVGFELKIPQLSTQKIDTEALFQVLNTEEITPPLPGSSAGNAPGPRKR